VSTLAELEEAIADAKKQTISILIDIKVLPKTMTKDYESWWHVGVAGVSEKKKFQQAYQNKENNLKNARQY
jgi:3D-(3,5/4)-trihydroxycyclohexane-1,2-dione acylhydrolase (decyclizing)